MSPTAHARVGTVLTWAVWLWVFYDANNVAVRAGLLLLALWYVWDWWDSR